VYRQRFTVEYDFPVCFTENLFDPDNPILRDTVAGSSPNGATGWRSSLTTGWPGLSRPYRDRFRPMPSHHGDRLELVVRLNRCRAAKRSRTIPR
jgi:hypothetical protein